MSRNAFIRGQHGALDILDRAGEGLQWLEQHVESQQLLGRCMEAVRHLLGELGLLGTDLEEGPG